MPLAPARIQAVFFGVLAGTAPACWPRVGAPSTTYEPRHPAQSLLYQIVREDPLLRAIGARVRHLREVETFRAQAASLRDGEGLPRFVEQEFRDFLQCGWRAGGFARFHCDDCASTGWSRFPAKAARSVPVAAAVGWPSAPPTCSITCSPTRPCASGC